MQTYTGLVFTNKEQKKVGIWYLCHTSGLVSIYDITDTGLLGTKWQHLGSYFCDFQMWLFKQQHEKSVLKNVAFNQQHEQPLYKCGFKPAV